MTWSTARTRWRSTKTRSSRDRESSSSTIFWRPAERPMPALQLAQSLGAKVEGMGFAVELDFLSGREKFDGTEVFSLLHYDK